MTDVPEGIAQRGASVRQLETARGSGHAVVHQRSGLRHADSLDRHRHHDAREARARLAHDQRVHRAGGSGELCGEVGKARLHGRGGRVAPKLGTEPRVDQEPLDQLAREHVVAISG